MPKTISKMIMLVFITIMFVSVIILFGSVIKEAYICTSDIDILKKDNGDQKNIFITQTNSDMKILYHYSELGGGGGYARRN